MGKLFGAPKMTKPNIIRNLPLEMRTLGADNNHQSQN